MTDLRDQVRADYLERAQSGSVGIKVNLYTSLDVHGLAWAMTALPKHLQLESVMVGDSILCTHHGRQSTQLPEVAEQEWACAVLADALAEVAAALRDSQLTPTYLMADLPDGSLTSSKRLLQRAERFVNLGASAIKIEGAGDDSLRGIEILASIGIPVFGHIGYTPQSSSLRRHGRTRDERRDLYRTARAVRDCGACGLILEMVHPLANAALSAFSPHGIPCFSIFSGPAVPGGGLSLNAWDALFRHPSSTSGFPQSAFLEIRDYPAQYTLPNISRALILLFQLVAVGQFPQCVSATPDVHQSGSQEPDDPWLGPSP